MATLIETVTNRQPNGITPLVPSGIGTGLVGAWMGNVRSPLFNAAADKRELTTSGSPTFALNQELGTHVMFSGSQYLRQTNFRNVSANPVTFVVKFRADTLAPSLQTIMAATVNGTTSCIMQLYLSGSALNARQFNSGDATITGLVTGKIYTAAVTFDGISSRTLYLVTDGVIQNAFSSSTGPSPASVNQIDIGASPWAGPGEFFTGAIGCPMVFNRTLSQAEILSLANNPWQVYQPQNQKLLVAVASGGTTTNINPSVGNLTVTGFAPTVAQTANQSVSPSVGTLSITGFAPTVTQSSSSSITPSTGNLTITGFAPTITQPNSLNMVLGSLTITGFAPIIAQGPPAAPNTAMKLQKRRHCRR